MEKQSQHFETFIHGAFERRTLSPSGKVLRKLKARLWWSDFMSINPRKLNVVYTSALLGGIIVLTAINPLKEPGTPAGLSATKEMNKTGDNDRQAAGIKTPATTESAQPPSNSESENSVSAGSAIFMASVTRGCAPLTVRFSNHDASASAWHWEFGNGEEADIRNPVCTFTKGGNYDVELTVTDNAGHRNSFRQSIEVFEKPQAQIDIDVENSDIAKKSLVFKNNSEGAVSYHWDFGDGNVAGGNKNTHSYADFGVYKVKLIAVSEKGCSDTATLLNNFIEKNYALSFPLTFKPNPVERNNGYYEQAGVETSVFYPTNNGVEKYQLTIYAPNGLKIFSSGTIKQGWDGYIGGRLAPAGLYSWTAKGVYPNGKSFSLKGTVKVLSQDYE